MSETEKIYQIDYAQEYFEGLKKHEKSGQKNIFLKIDKLIDELEIHPTTGTGKVEQLKGYKERSVYSRRIDQKHRLTYEILEEEKLVEILACWGHYDDQ